MKGAFIGVKEKRNTFVVKKFFTTNKIENAVLRITALGLYFAEINGKRVGDCYLTPGWTSYNKTLQVQNYDVTNLVREGENEISLTVNDGWYRGRLTWNNIVDRYGAQSAVCADLILDERTISTDNDWIALESPIRESGIYDGETVDYKAECKPLTPVTVSFDKQALVQQISEPVRTTERLPVIDIIRTPKGELVYDFGQNLAGVVELKTPEGFDGTITLRFAEILVNGNFYTDNLRSAKATDTFIVKGMRTISPEFTFHGFRYMKMEGAELSAERVTALVRHTDMKRTGYIRTDNKRFQRLYENVVWGQRGNFVDIPTDCPQRDERLGWTGDINAFCRTAAYNYDIRLFMKKWLKTLRDDQAKEGGIPYFAPDVTDETRTDAFWCDAITMVPWTLYEMYGDISFLSENFAAMKKFIAARERMTVNGLSARGHEFGDWLALDREALVPASSYGRTDVYYIANVFFAVSLKITADTAILLGDEQAEKKYRSRYDSLIKKIRKEYVTPNGRIAVDTATAYAIALHFHIVPDHQREKLAACLNAYVYQHGFRVTTGFIGTPFLLFALADNGYFETARRLLLNNAYPGWLYEVDMGATTIWERWNSLMPDGTPNPDGMNSYNHYAYGSVMEFVYRRVAGIDALSPGFKKIRIAPNPCKGLPNIYAEYDSVQGKIIAGYEQSGSKIMYFAKTPEGIETEIILPGEPPIYTTGGEISFEREEKDWSNEPYTPESAVTEVFENPKAVRAFNEVFGGIFTGTEIAWMKNEPKTLQFMAEFRDMEGKMKLSDFPAMLARANDLFKRL